MLVYPKADVPHIVFTQRTETLSSHRGQIALPGGRQDPTDHSLEATALRETNEELGIDVGEVEVWGKLEEVYVRVSNFLITPYVGALPYAPTYEVNEAEVARVIEVPVTTLRDPSIFREEEWRLGGALRRIQIYEYDSHVIWGATARVVELFLSSDFAERASRWKAPIQTQTH